LVVGSQFFAGNRRSSLNLNRRRTNNEEPRTLAALYPKEVEQLGRTLIIIGVLIAIFGAVFYFSGRANLPIGRLPGDITYRKGHFTFYAPLATSILLSIILSVILYFLNRR
jgi:hypothetical protein